MKILNQTGLFSGLSYPGHFQTALVVLATVALSLVVFLLDHSVVVAFAIVPGTCFHLWLNDAGLQWRTHKREQILLLGVYAFWTLLALVMHLMLTAG